MRRLAYRGGPAAVRYSSRAARGTPRGRVVWRRTSRSPFDDLWYSRALAAAGSQTRDPLLAARARQEALAAGLRATRTGENPQNAWYHVATLRAAVNDFAGTERSLHEAIAAAPNWFKPHWTLARLLSMAGRTSEARTEAAAAAQLNRKDPEVARTLAEIRRK